MQGDDFDGGRIRMAELLENYEKLLSASLAPVTDWLKFSETKNAALLALASGWTVAATNVALRKEGIPTLAAFGRAGGQS